MKTFIHDFGGGIRCEFQVTDDAPPRGECGFLGTVWSGGPPSMKLLRPYIAWVNSIYRGLADEWKIRIRYAYQISKSTYEIWDFEPGKRPKKAGTKNLYDLHG